MITTSIIIVNYNSGDALRELLESLSPERTPDLEILIIDNASADDSMDCIADFRDGIRIVMNSDNVGFGKAVNQGIHLSKGRFVLLLNPDIVLCTGAVRALENFMIEHPDAGIAGGKIFSTDGTLQLACRRGFPTPWVAFSRLSGLSFLLPKSKLFARYNMTFLDENSVSEVDAVSGSFMLIRRDALDVAGVFDEDFFLYAEDIDICYRVHGAGWKIYYDPAAAVTHKKRTSAGSNQVRATYEFYNTMWTFHKKHFKRSTPALFNLFIWLGIACMKYSVTGMVILKKKIRR